MASNENFDALARWEIVLGAYELRSFAVAPEVRVTGFTPHPPAEVATALLEDGRRALQDLDALRDAAHLIPGMDIMQHDIETAIEEGRLAWLRRALAGYIVRKCRAELGRGKGQVQG